MIRLAVISAVLFLACDRVDVLLAASLEAALADPPQKSGHAVDCAKGSARYAAPNVQLTIDCRPTQRDGGAR